MKDATKTVLTAVLTAVEAFLERHNMSASRLGKEVFNNPNFVSDLRTGIADPKVSTVSRLYDWMAKRDVERIFQYDEPQ